MNPLQFFLGLFGNLFRKDREAHTQPDPAKPIITAKEAKALHDAKTNASKESSGLPGEATQSPRDNIELKEPARNPMRINQRGIDLIKSFEGLELQAYPDPGTGGDPWTIGYGHTGPEVKKGLKITPEEAEDFLKKDLEKFEKGVTSLIRVPINENQFSALISFAYNCGLGNLRSSTLLRLLNSGDYVGASKQFLRWNRAAGKVLKGLTNRRTAERDLFDLKI